jgi:phage baseplate assembly protein W
MNPARHPYRLVPARRLAEADDDRHVADLVRLTLLTNPGERLHHADFGAGLGPAVLFEPLQGALTGVVEMRARGSLERALGDRIEVRQVTVTTEGESTLRAEVTYRVKPAGTPRTIHVEVTP